MTEKRKKWPRFRFPLLILLLIGQFGLSFFAMQKLWFGVTVFWMRGHTWGRGGGVFSNMALVNPPGAWYARWGYMGKWGLVFGLSLATIFFLMKDCLDRSTRFDER